MTPSRVYLDTSAYLCLLLGEAGAASMKKHIGRSVLCSSAFLFLEAERNLIRLVRERVLGEEEYDRGYTRLREDQEAFLLRDFTPDLCLTREFPIVKTPRSSDLVHLRTALWFHRNGGIRAFLSLDKAQIAAARELGLPQA